MDQREPDLDISIRWKVAAAFVTAAVLPVLLAWVGAPLPLATGVGLAVAAILALYSTRQILGAVRAVRRLTVRLAPGSPVAGLRHGDELAELINHVDALVDQVEDRLKQGVAPEETPRPGRLGRGRQVFTGRFGTGGPVEAEGVLLPRREIEASAVARSVAGPRAREVFRSVRDRARRELDRLQQEAGLRTSERGIIEFQRLLLDDEALAAGVERGLAQGLDLLESLTTTFGGLIAQLENADRDYLRMRADDCRDLERRLLYLIHAEVVPGESDAASTVRGRIVLSGRILPTEVLFVHRAGAKGLVIAHGAVSSHAQILLQSLDFPSLTQFDDLPLETLAGVPLLLDPPRRRVVARPRPDDKAVVTAPIQLVPAIEGPVKLASGEPFGVMASVNNAFTEPRAAAAAGADGIGLFRSEMTFIGRPEPPRESDLVEEYGHLTAAFPDSTVVMRLLDLGYDKLAFLGGGERDGPMGLRSIRLLVRHPDLLRTQLRAMLRVAHDKTMLLVPFVSGADEVDVVRELIDEARADVERERPVPRVGWGMMVEVPAVAARFEDYVERFDCFSIGSNDLTQYTLAADRNDSEVADYYRATHPAVLSLIRRVCTLARERGKPVTLCGEAATQADLLPLWVGIGLTSVSVGHRLVPRMKAAVTKLDRAACVALAEEALRGRSIRDVDEILRARSLTGT